MDAENPQATSNTSSSIQSELDREPDPAAEAHNDLASLDASALVAEMVAAGRWPEPELMERIVAAGDAAVEPLVALLRSKPRGWDAETPLYHALQLLEAIHAPAAIPELIEVARSYRDTDVVSAAGAALASFGSVTLESLLELCRDPSFSGYRRASLIDAAIQAAGNDPESRARVAEVLRPMMSELMNRIRKDRIQAESGSDIEPLGASGEEMSLSQEEEIAHLTSNLTTLADPLARDMIQTAFDEDMVDTSVIDERDVDSLYERGGDRLARYLANDWLRLYRESYQNHVEGMKRVEKLPPEIRAALPEHLGNRSERPEPEQIAVVAPIRNDKAKRGRNDPCWCGSGKKYKKCHLAMDARV
jgi:hypothetical protein